MVGASVQPLLLAHQQDDGNPERADHRHHLAPGVDAPPEPAQQVEQAGAGADLQDDVEVVLGRVHAGRPSRPSTRNRPTVARRPATHVVLLGGVRPHEAPVEIVDQVRRAPVEVGQDGGGVGGDQPADHQPDQADGQELEHGRVGDVVAEQLRVEVRETPSGCRTAGGIDDERAEADEDPRPGPQHVVRDVEEQHARRARPSRISRPACAGRCSCRRPVPRRDTTRPTTAPRSA